MVVNKHSSFYMRNGWGTKIIDAINNDVHIFSPSNEQKAVDEIGLGRVMIKALRYWSVSMGLSTEIKSTDGIAQERTEIFSVIEKNDRYFMNNGSLLLLHRNLATNIDEATAIYWLFNEWDLQTISKEEFVDGFHSFLAVNGMKIKKDAVEKEFNCVRSTYIGDSCFDIKSVMDEDTYPFFAPLGILKVTDNKEDKKERKILKTHLQTKDIPVELLTYFVAEDNIEESKNKMQVNIDKLLEEKMQVGKYLNIKYSHLIELLLEAENKGYISLNNNFGNRYIEFLDKDYKKLLTKYYTGKEA